MITETVFSWPGIRLLTVEAIQRRDYPVVQATVLFISLAYVLINLATDLMYAWIDPRVHIGRKRMMRLWGPLGLLVLWGILAILGPVFPLTPEHVELSKILVGPGSEEWLGYDDLGRPIVDRLIMGVRTSFVVALFVVLLTSVVGGFLGIVGAYVGGMVDSIVVWVIDVFLAFPGPLTGYCPRWSDGARY